MKMRTWFKPPLLPTATSFKIRKNKNKSGSKEEIAAGRMVKVNASSRVVKEESPSLEQQGRKHMSLAPKELESIRAAELLQRRRTSASVDEIRDLYSALQELVPGPSNYSSPPRGDSTHKNGAENSAYHNSPKPRKQLFGNTPIDSSHYTSLGSDNVDRSQLQKETGNAQVKRIFPETTGSPSNARKFNSRTIQALDVNANHSPKKGKRLPYLGRRGSSGEVLLGARVDPGSLSPDIGRRGSNAEILFNVRTNQSKPLSPLVRPRGLSSLVAGEKAQSNMKEAMNLAHEMNSLSTRNPHARRGSDGEVSIPQMDIGGHKTSRLLVARRGSSGDVLTMESKKNTMQMPRSPLVSPRSNSLLNTLEPVSHATDDPSLRRGSLVNALTKFSSPIKRKKHTKGIELNDNQSLEDTDEHSRRSKVDDGSELDSTPTSLDDPKMQVSASDSEISKKTSGERQWRSQSTNVQEHHGVLHDLSKVTTSSDSESLGDSEFRSRCSSELHVSNTVQRESLDQLEAYFNEKLRDATKGKTSKTPSERSSESDVPHSDKEDGDIKQFYSNGSSKKTSLDMEPIDEGIDVVDHLEILKSSSDPELKRPQLMEDTREFANQVNRKLQDWLTKAVALSVQEKQVYTDCTSESDDSRENAPYSDDENSNKTKKTKMKIKRNIFSKLSFLRRGDRQRKYKHRRTRSLHDIAFPFESQHYVDDSVDEDDHKTTKTEKPVEKARRVSVSRSKSMFDISSDRSSKRKKERASSESRAMLANEVEVMSKASAMHPSHPRGGICDSSVEMSNRASSPSTGVDVSTRTTGYQNIESESIKRLQEKKRLFRFPTNLPIFYTPNTKNTPVDGLAKSSVRYGKKSFLNHAGAGEIFYSETDRHKPLKKLPSDPRHLDHNDNIFYSGTSSSSSSSSHFSRPLLKDMTLFYQGETTTASSSLRRCASQESFLDSGKADVCDLSPYKQHWIDHVTVQGNPSKGLCDIKKEHTSNVEQLSECRWDMEFTV